MIERAFDTADSFESVIQLDLQDFYIADETFARACLTHGDCDEFTWMSCSDIYNYSVRRISKGYSKNNGPVVSSWKFTQVNRYNGETSVILMNTDELELVDGDANSLSPRLVNDFYEAVVDIHSAIETLDRDLELITIEDFDGEGLLSYRPNRVHNRYGCIE